MRQTAFPADHRQYFNRLAPTWSNHPAPAEVEEALRQFVAPGDAVLDVGTGTVTGVLRRLCGGGTVVAADLSEKMLSEAKKRLRDESILYLCTDACRSAVASESFDKIVCYSSFPHFQSPPAAIVQFFRMLKPRGKVLIFHTCCSRRLNHFHATLKEVVSFDKLPKSEQLAELMRSVGFVEIVYKEQPSLYWVEARKPL